MFFVVTRKLISFFFFTVVLVQASKVCSPRRKSANSETSKRATIVFDSYYSRLYPLLQSSAWCQNLWHDLSRLWSCSPIRNVRSLLQRKRSNIVFAHSSDVGRDVEPAFRLGRKLMDNLEFLWRKFSTETKTISTLCKIIHDDPFRLQFTEIKALVFELK